MHDAGDVVQVSGWEVTEEFLQANRGVGRRWRARLADREVDDADAAERELYEAALRVRLERECRTGMLEVAREAGFWVRGPVLPGARTRLAKIRNGEEPMPKEWT